MILVTNTHERRLPASPDEIGVLLDGLGGPADALWPSFRWPRMHLDRPLQVGASGGHGPIRYVVETHVKHRSVKFRFTAPRGFDGTHSFEVVADGRTGATLRHVLVMKACGPAVVTWPMVFKPLHDALIEDCLDNAAFAVGLGRHTRPLGLRVGLLRAGLGVLRRRSELDVPGDAERRER